MLDLSLRLSRLTDSLFSVTARIRRPDVITFTGPIDSVTTHHVHLALLCCCPIPYSTDHGGDTVACWIYQDRHCRHIKAAHTHIGHTHTVACCGLPHPLSTHLSRRSSILASVTISFATVVLRFVLMLSFC